jgi:integrase
MLALARNLPSEFRNLPLPTALARLLEARRTERRWTWATMLKNLASMQGALTLLPLYHAVPHGLLLKQNPIWQQTIQAAARKAREEIPRTPFAMSPDLFRRTLSAERNPQRGLVLAIMWYTSARVGCVLQLHQEDIALRPDRTMSVTFHRGKGVLTRGPYTVHTTTLPEPMFQLLRQALVNAIPRRPLFNLRPADLLATFRIVDRTMEARSIRRGSLQTMATAGVPTADLMRYSGHTSERTLLRYLNWGAKASEMQGRMANAGVHLNVE